MRGQGALESFGDGFGEDLTQGDGDSVTELPHLLTTRTGDPPIVRERHHTCGRQILRLAHRELRP